MSRKNRSIWQYLWDRRTSAKKTGRLAARAGLAMQSTFEPLEQRQLLFTLGITPNDVDQETGLGTVRAYFGYTIPALIAAAEPGTNVALPVVEDFSDEAVGGLFSGRIFLESGIRTRHNIFPNQPDYIIDFLPDGTGQPTQDRWITARPSAGEFYDFSLLAVDDDPQAPVLPSRQFQFTIRGGPQNPFGLPTDNVRIEFLLGGLVVNTLTGAGIRAANVDDPNDPNDVPDGLGVFLFDAPGDTAFDTVRVTTLAGNVAYQIDDITFQPPAGNWGVVVEPRIFGVEVVLTGPVGASARFLDLYGREMVRTIALGTPPRIDVVLVDTDDNGIPNFNDGIGRIIMTGTDSRTALTLWGGTIDSAETAPLDAEFFQAGFVFQRVESIVGIYDDFEQAGFGYVSNSDPDPAVDGLPAGPGSLIIGSPFVRPLDNYNPAGFAPGTLNPVTTGFVRSDQGIQVLNGESMGGIYIHGVLHGSSRITGALDRAYVGYLVGSLTVDGDLGALVIGTDAGQWSPDPGFDPGTVQVEAINKTGAQVVIGRTVGEVAIAGRSLLDLTVVGDLNSPSTRPPRDIYTYYEREAVYEGLVDNEHQVVTRLLFDNDFVGQSSDQLFRTTQQAMVFGSSVYRNDSFSSAEWVGSIGTGVRIKGDIGADDVVNTDDDSGDAFAFAVDGTTEIVVQAESLATGVADGRFLYRLIDESGRTVAAAEFSRSLQDRAFLRYRPTQPGVLYLVLTDPQGDPSVNGGTVQYSATIHGMAATALGMYRTGASMGAGRGTIFDPSSNSINVLSGSIGAIRIGTGQWASGGGDVDTNDTFNTALDADDAAAALGTVISVPGSLFSFFSGSDIQAEATNPFRLIIGRDLGSFSVGVAPAIGIAPEEGDLTNAVVRIGGRVGFFDIRGGIGINQDAADPLARVGADSSVSIQTGTEGGSGDIGMFRVGSHVRGDVLSLHTSPGSVLGAFLVSQDIGFARDDARYGIYFGQFGVDLVTGIGSDVRFVDIPRIDLFNSVNVVFPFFAGQTLTLVDDGGAQITVSAEGDTPGPGGRLGYVVAIPVDGSQGVAIGQLVIEGNLTSLSINGVAQPGSNARATIGRILLDGGGFQLAGAIEIGGNVEIDVMRMDLAGATLVSITNSTPNGDIVFIDVDTITNVTISGDLGLTEMPAFGPQNLGNYFTGFAGIDLGNAPLDDDFNGQVFRPVNDQNFDAGNAYLDDIGSPVDVSFNGLIVRTAILGTGAVNVNGAVADVIIQGGNLPALRANADSITAFGRFDGIVGNIFVSTGGILSIDIGDGLAAPGDSPLAAVGIFASDDILSVTGGRLSGPGGIGQGSPADIRGIIIAGNSDPATPNLDGIQGIGTITLTGGGDYIDAFIGATNLDGFWQSVVYADDNIALGNIRSITGTDADFVRSRLFCRDLDSFTLTGGIYDASEISALGNVGTISADHYQNSTLVGGILELHFNEIVVGGNVQTITTAGTTGGAGDMTDLAIDVVGTVLGSINARHMTRVAIDVDNIITLLTVTGSFRGSSINTGALLNATVAADIQSSRIEVSGPLTMLTVGSRIVNTYIAVTGPSGAIGTITAPTLISGEISASGPITSITVPQGDLTARIVTTTSQGNVGILSAGRDLAITADISGNVTTLTAGRHMGDRSNPGVILVRGNLQGVTLAGQLYSDLRVGQSILTPVTIGEVPNRPGDNLLGSGSVVAFGRIFGVNIRGDFDGDIISYSGGLGPVVITDGSFLPGNTISAYDGNVESVVITNGHLLGGIYADLDIVSVRVVASADGIFGDVGLNPALSAAVPATLTRNQLPPGLTATSAFDGPRIQAGRNIVSFEVTNGSVFETGFHAGVTIQRIIINGDVVNDGLTVGYGSFFAAGDLIDQVIISGNAIAALVIAGVVDLGTDNRPEGKGDASDLIKSGIIDEVRIGGFGAAVAAAAGINAGADGFYNTGDETVALGNSIINVFSVSGPTVLVSAFSDIISTSVSLDPKILSTALLPPANSQIATAIAGVQIFGSALIPIAGGTMTLSFSGGGSAFYDAATNRVILVDTNAGSTFTASSSTGVLTDLDIVSTDESSLGLLRVTSTLAGDSDIIIDGAVNTLELAAMTGTGSITIGDSVSSAAFGTFTGGFYSSRFTGAITINGQYGSSTASVIGEVRIDVLAGGSITINGPSRGLINVSRDLGGLIINGPVERSLFRVGGDLPAFSANSLSQSRLSVLDNLGPVVINGDVFDSAIIAGTDLGADVEFGGATTGVSRLNRDRLTTGSIASVVVVGAFRESDIISGITRGPDGFFGTGDDRVAEGRSAIGAVTIGGPIFGSNRNSESYRIASSGTVANVLVGGALFQAQGNMAVAASNLAPVAISVSDLRVTFSSSVYTGTLTFTQAIDASSLSAALSIWEVRGTGEIRIRLIEGVEYTLRYIPATTTATVTFSREVTQRNLPVLSGVPGQGVFQFNISQALLRGQLALAQLDGDGNGQVGVADNFSEDTIVGDAGDKTVAERITLQDELGFDVGTVDFYAPTNLNLVLDANRTFDGVPDANRVFTVRGAIGDHPDNDTNFFRFAGDTDVYSVTLQAGQILRLGAMSGSALFAGRSLVDPAGDIVPVVGESAGATTLPQKTLAQTDLVFENSYLIRQTGTYLIVLSNAGAAFQTPGQVPNLESIPGAVGNYNFTVEVFDDGDSGFNATTDSGDGALAVDAPAPISFAGADQIFGTPDDIATISLSGFVFTHDHGTDGVPNTLDDLVSGSNGSGITSVRTGAGRITTTIDSAIGPEGHAGTPTDATPDVDVYHLNGGSPIAPGTRLTATVKLIETGSDLGSQTLDTFDDFRGWVQFGFFDTSAATGLSDATMVFSPTDFSSHGSSTRTIASSDGATYGYDANGDFFINFVAPDRLDLPGASGRFALYLQGVFNSDYTIEVVTEGTGVIERRSQNVFIETNGGSIDWLEAGGRTTDLLPVDFRSLGFVGAATNGQPVQDYILDRTVGQLNAIFQNAGFDVRFSTNVTDFEFGDFSTVFLTNQSDPLSLIFNELDLFGIDVLLGQAAPFRSNEPYGFSQRSDPFNADTQDEAAVFVPSFALLGYTPSQSDVDDFTQSLTASIGRRVGELVGLRITNAGVSDVTSSASVVTVPGSGESYTLSVLNRDLSGSFDSIDRSNFFLGQQNAASLLDRYLGRL